MAELSILLQTVLKFLKVKNKSKLYFYPLNGKIERIANQFLKAQKEESMPKFTHGEYKDNPKDMFSISVNDLEDFLAKR